MRKLFAAAAATMLLCLGGLAQAVTIDTVLVGDQGNAPDTRYGTPGYGSVGYIYSIGKYEVTAGQYTEFLNAVARTDARGLYNLRMSDAAALGCGIRRSGSSGTYSYSVAPDLANRPVNYVSWWDSCRFANWLHNGQRRGDTEKGAYTLNGYKGRDGRTIQRNIGWKWAVSSEDEWYKAAFYKGGGMNARYWEYATQNAKVPSNDLGDPTDPGNNATFYDATDYTIGDPYWRTEVGAHMNSESAYGTFDQGGNVWERNEAIAFEDATHAKRCIRGGSFKADLGDAVNMFYCLRAMQRTWINSEREDSECGFRVVQAVPAPPPARQRLRTSSP